MLSFDDGPVPGKTESILATLDEFGVKATLGWRVSEDVEVGGIDLAEHGEAAYETIGSGRVITEGKA